LAAKSFAVSDDRRMTESEFLKEKAPSGWGGAKYNRWDRMQTAGMMIYIPPRSILTNPQSGVVPVADSVAGR
jgi:hypothetical protein